MEHWPGAKDWPDPIGWCAWYISNGFMATLHKKNGEIGAMAAARPVNCPEDGDTPYKHAKDGDCIFVDFLAVDDGERLALPGFALLLFHRFGERKQIAFVRKSVHTYDGFMRNLSRIRGTIGEPNGTTENTTVSA
jgi:hypothetical protein